MHRRDFLKVSGAAAGSALGTFSFLSNSEAAWGDFPAAAASHAMPVKAKSILEIFLYGGLSPWETLYFVPTYGTPTDPQFPNQQFYTFGTADIDAALGACGTTTGAPYGVDFALDGNGVQVQLGPFARTLSARTDLTDRMRVLVHRHDLEPHEAAIPLALSGKRVGLPSLAGLGAHIQRYFLDQGDPNRKAPYSYLFSTGGIPGDNVLAAAATGFHPGVARPLNIKVDSASGLYNLLARNAVGSATDRDNYDAAIAAYVSQFDKRLRFHGAGAALRSRRYSDLAQSSVMVHNADAVATVLDQSLFTPIAGSTCGDNNTNLPAESMKIAAHLLTHPTEPARYVCISDVGLIEASGGGGYDTHTDNSHDTARNFKNMLDALTSIINLPTGTQDPSKISLDDTMIIINTEFGRTPTAQSGNGRNHHPYGYVQAFLGGPVTSAQKGIYGAIGPDGMATTFLSPAESRMAALLAMGIYPFSQESFFVSDVPGSTSEADGIVQVTKNALGYDV